MTMTMTMIMIMIMFSFGFVVISRMLQMNPELCEQVDLVISIVGFSQKSDFKFKRKTYLLFRWCSSICSTFLVSAFLKHVILKGPVISLAYKSVADKHVKMKDADEDERKKRIKFEVFLWKCNDIRTYMDTTITMMKLDITDIKIDKDLMHVAVDADQYFDNRRVKKHLKLIYNSVDMHKAVVPNHAPTVIATEETARAFIPKSIRQKIVKFNRS